MGNFNYKQQYGVIVICKDEQEQKAVYERLLAEGFTLKIVTV
nr:MAG TPA: arginine repressor [Caudoviricetes sp.]